MLLAAFFSSNFLQFTGFVELTVGTTTSAVTQLQQTTTQATNINASSSFPEQAFCEMLLAVASARMSIGSAAQYEFTESAIRRGMILFNSAAKQKFRSISNLEPSL